MKYKLNKEYIKDHGGEVIHFSRFAKVVGIVDFRNKNTIDAAAKNQDLLEQLYDLGKPYVEKVSQDAKTKVKSKPKNKIKKVCKDDSKETNYEQKEEQVLSESSEK
jgi:hypothetical protein